MTTKADPRYTIEPTGDGYKSTDRLHQLIRTHGDYRGYMLWRAETFDAPVPMPERRGPNKLAMMRLALVDVAASINGGTVNDLHAQQLRNIAAELEVFERRDR